MSKTIFLDFDGPLHPTESIRGIPSPITQQVIDERNLFRWVPLLEDAVANSPACVREGLCIAAHSSWRLRFDVDQQIVRNNLRSLASYYVGMTNPALLRWPSIQDMCQRAQIEDYLIIDDAIDEFPQNLQQLIVCSPSKGLSDQDVMSRLTQWLHSEAPAHKHIAT